MSPFSNMRNAMPGSKASKEADSASQYSGHDRNTTPRTYPKRIHLLALLPVLVTAIALVLAFLCVFAGHTTSMMQDYAVFTLNTSRIGESFVHKVDDKIRSFGLDDVGLARRNIVLMPAVSTTAVPTTLITMAPVAPRAIISEFNSLKSKADSKLSKATHHIGSAAESLKSKGESEISDATEYIHSKANSLEGAALAEASAIITKIEDELIHLIHEAYNGMIDGLAIKDFYNVHVMASCHGTYAFQNGTNVTVGHSGIPSKSGPDSIHPIVDVCENHSAVDPMSIAKIIYWVGIAFVILALLTGSLVIFRGFSTKLVFLNIIMSMFAFFAMGLASAVIHGLALAATKVINFLGHEVGIAAYLGHKFLALTWAATGLLVLNILLWMGLFFWERRQGGREVVVRTEKSGRGNGYAMQDISQPRPQYRTQ